MKFEDLATQAGRAAGEVGRQATRPPFDSITRVGRSAALVWLAAGAVGVVLLGAAVLFWPASEAPIPLGPTVTPVFPTTSSAATTTAETLDRVACPVTVPGPEPFSPAAETPEGPPPSYESVWFGSPELWTRIHVNGEYWENLPVAADGSLTQKTFWWREGFSMIEESVPDITVAMEPVAGSGDPVVAPGPATSGGHPELGEFMIVGIQIPGPGCWTITSQHRQATLSYVVWVGG